LLETAKFKISFVGSNFLPYGHLSLVPIIVLFSHDLDFKYVFEKRFLAFPQTTNSNQEASLYSAWGGES